MSSFCASFARSFIRHLSSEARDREDATPFHLSRRTLRFVYSNVWRWLDIHDCIAVCACVNERMMPAAMLAVMVFYAAWIEQLAHMLRLPSRRRTIEQIAQ
jgi:hypothetical protein